MTATFLTETAVPLNAKLKKVISVPMMEISHYARSGVETDST
jgi:hypothetical protein